MALKTMSIDKLMKLKDQVEAALASKVIEQRRALESELSKLGRYQGGAGPGEVTIWSWWHSGRHRTEVPQSRESE